MNKIFVDSDVILDLLCKREPYYQDAAAVFTLCDKKQLNLYTTSLVFANVYYILRKIVGIENAKKLVKKIRLLVHVISVYKRL